MATSTDTGRQSPAADRADDDTAHRLARAAARSAWGDRGARVGLAARGVAFLVLGYLVARIAFGALGAQSTSHSASGPGVAQALAAQPGGRAILVVLGVGLALYAMFSLLDAILHHDDETPTAKRWGDRFLSAFGVVLYGAFSVYCFTTAASSSPGKQTANQSDAKQRHWSAQVLQWPGGPFWLGAFGIVLLVIAFFLVTRCLRTSYRERLDRPKMSPGIWQVALVAGFIGYLGRALLFGIVGWFITLAAVENDPRHGQGVDGSARQLAQSSGGGVLLIAVAAALIVYAGYLFIEARYRKI